MALLRRRDGACPRLGEIPREGVLWRSSPVRFVAQRSRRVIEVAQSDCRFGNPGEVVPQSRFRHEPVVEQELPTVGGDEVDGVEEEGEDRFGKEVVEVDSNPPRLDAFAAANDFAFEFLGSGEVDAEKAMAVGPGTGASGPRLNAEQVAKERGDEIVGEGSGCRRSERRKTRSTNATRFGCQGFRCWDWRSIVRWRGR